MLDVDVASTPTETLEVSFQPSHFLDEKQTLFTTVAPCPYAKSTLPPGMRPASGFQERESTLNALSKQGNQPLREETRAMVVSRNLTEIWKWTPDLAATAKV